MDEQPERCRLLGVIQEVLLKISFLPQMLHSCLQHLDDPEVDDWAQQLIINLEKGLRAVLSSKLCPPRTGSVMHPECHCHLLRSRIQEPATQRAVCDGEQLITSIRNQRDKLHAFLDASRRDDFLQLGQATELTWQLIPVIFQDATAIPLPKPSSDSMSPFQVRNDFAQAFHGTALELLQRYIANLNAFINQDENTEIVYAKSLPILQSSGTGKTKLAVQLSAYQAGMLVCTRSQNRLPTSFPPFDQPVFTFFRQTISPTSPPTEKGLIVQHERLAAWLGAYFDVLATYIQRLKLRSECFTPDGNCRHKDVALCWKSVVYQLARRIHGGSDFILDYKFQDDNQPHMQLCPQSKLNLPLQVAAPAQQAACDLDDTSFGSDSSLFSSQQSDKSSKHSSHEVACFRTALLHKVTNKAQCFLNGAGDTNHTQEPRDDAQDVDNDAIVDDNGKAKRNDQATRCGPNEAATSTFVAQNDKQNKPAEIAERAAKRYIRSHLEALENTLPEPLRKADGYFFFLAVDEVREIIELLPILRRLWRESQPVRTWLILIDTESSIADLAGDGVIEASLRLGDEEGKVIVPPFTFLPFDVHFAHQLQHTRLRQQLREGTLTFASLVNVLRWFGRPLWGTGLYSRPFSPNATDNTLERPHLRNILKKLFYGHLDSTKLWPVKADGGFFDIVMAAAGQRLPLNFVGHQNARLPSSRNEAHARSSSSRDDQVEATKANLIQCRAFLQRQVSKYLRIVCDVNRTDSYVTATPSKPAVSLAVASQFRGSSRNALRDCANRWSDTVQVLAKAHRSTGLMLGEEGEECVRLLLTMATDVVAARRVAKVAASRGNLAEGEVALFHAQCDPICLRDWLVSLLNMDEIRFGGACKSAHKLFKWASDFYLNFTHFVKLGCKVLPNQADPALLVEYWCRQAAVYGVQNQDDWDLLMPIYRSASAPSGPSDAFDPNQLSYVAVQVKNSGSHMKATDRFGPSYLFKESLDSSADVDAAATSSQ